MTKRSDALKARPAFRMVLTALIAAGFSNSATSQAAEPETPPPTTQPHQHSVDLREKVTIRMGDTITLKGTAFSAKLVGFQEGFGFNPEPVPQFQLREGTTVCEPGKADAHTASCTVPFAYTVNADRVTDRTAVKVQIQKKTEKQRLEEKHRSHKRNRK